MADIESNINVNIDTSEALASIKALQREISVFHSSMAKSGAVSNGQLAQMQQNLVNSINATGNFSAQMKTVKTTTESFTTALEKNKLSMGEYFRYAGASSRTFGRMFTSEFQTIEKVARERVKDLQTQYIKMGRDANGAMQSIAVRPLTLDMKDLGTQTAIAAQKSQIFNQLIKQGSTNMLNFGKNTQWAGRQLMVGFTVPLGIMGAAAAKEFMKLEEQAIRFKRVYGETFTPSSETDAMVEQIRTLATEFTKYGVAVEKTMGLAADAAAMGKQGVDLLAQVTEATRLSVLGGVDQQQALETTTALTNAFGTATDQLAGKINFLNGVENQTVTSIEDLTEAIPKAGPVVQQLGGDVEDLAFFLTAMKEGGINASEGANALKSGLASLINPTAKASEMLAGFGINIQGIVSANAGNVKGIVIDFAKALDTLDPLNRAQAIEQMFGKFQFSRLSTLFQNVIKEGSQAERVLKLSAATTEELAVLSERELKRVEDSPMYKFKGAMEDFKASLAPVGEAFLKAVTPIIEFGTKILDKFNSMSDEAKNFTVILTTVVAGVGPVLLMTFGLIANGVANLIKMFATVGGIFGKLGGQSTVLGEQTSYMTQQQLEAAAVAASLDQVHQTLRQTFTSEASAVRKLTAEYERAVAAQNNMRGPLVPGGRGRGAKKYAKGVSFVPGNGNKDTQPAMLTPGEAVIPKEMVKKYGPLIAGMVTGNIPGFAGGMLPMFGEYAIRLQNKKENMSQGAGSVGNLNQILAPLAARVGEARGITPTQKNVDTGKFDSIAKEFEGIATKFKDELNKNFETTYKHIEDTNERFAKSWDAAGKTVEKETNKIKSDADRGVVRKTFGLDPDFHGTIPTEPRKAGQTEPTRGRKSAFLKSQTGVGSYLPVGAAAKAIYERRTGESAADFQMGHVKKAKQVNIEDLLADPRRSSAVTTAARTMGIQITEGVVAGVNEAAQSASPSKKAKASGKNIADGAILGIEGGVDDAKVAGQKVGQAAAGGVTTPATGGRLSKVKGMLSPGRLAGAGMAVSGGLMMASMAPGQVGEIAQQLVGPMSALSMILPMLTSVGGAVTVALGAMAAAIIYTNMAFDKAQQSAMDMTESLDGSEKAIRSLAEFAGNVTAGEVMDKRRAAARSPLGVATGKGTFGESFIAEGAGKEMVDTLGKAVKELGIEGAKAKVSGQLTTAVASGALSTEQAKSVAANLGEAIGDYNFGIDVNAKITELLGPNGENLAKDPLQVRVKILDETGKRMRQTNAGLAKAGQINLGDTTTFLGSIAAGMGTGAAVGAGVGAIAGAPAAGVGAIPGAAIGAGIGTVAGGITGGIMGNMKRGERIASASGASVAMNKVALQQQQEMVDSLDLEYEKRIDVAKTIGDQARVDQLINEHIAARNALLEKGKQLNKDVYGSYATANEDVRGALNSGVRKSIENQYKGTPMEDVAKMATTSVTDANLTNEQEYTLLVKMDSGDLSPLQVQEMMDTFKSQEDLNKVMNLVMNMDSAAVDQVMFLTGKFTDEVSQKEFVAKIDAMVNDEKVTPQEIQEYIDTFQEISKLENVVDIEATMSMLVKNEGAYKKFKSQLDAIKASDNVTVELVADVLGADAAAALTSQVENFNSLPAEIRKSLVTTITTIQAGAKTKEFGEQYSNAKAAGFKGTKEQYTVELAKKTENDALKARNAQKQAAYDEQLAAYNESGGGGGGGGGEVQKVAVLDSLLKKIRDVRSSTIAMTNGWNESRNSIDAMFGSGLSGFNGLQQQMRNLGAGEDLITLIAGMDAEEYNRRKDELFTFDAAGNISQLRQGLASIGEAMRAIAIGDFQDKQQKTIGTIRDQSVAVNKLVAAGMSYADAYNAVQDTAYASAIAQEKNNDVIKQSIKDAREAARAMKELSAAQALAEQNQGLVDQGKLLDFLTKNASKLSDAQKKAILSDKNLQTLALNPQFDPNTFQDALNNVSNQADLELKLKKLTIGGMEEVFNDGFSKAMEAFSAKEKEINIQFKAKKDPLNDIIREAQQRIDDIQNAPGGMDDLEADLTRIGYQEEDINKAYDARFKALDEIAKINDKFTKQQRAQLGIADALSQGDIASAARQAQEMRATQAADAMADQRSILEKSRERELASLTSTMGLTREQIETRIKDLKKEIFNIEEQTIEPSQRQLDLLTRQEEAQIRALTVLGMSKAKWEEIQNSIDVARTNSDSYTKAIEGARDVVADILNYWNNIDGKQVTTDVVVRTTNVATAAPAVAPGIGPAPEAVTPGGGGGGAAAPMAPDLEQGIPYDPALDNVEAKKKPEAPAQPDWLTDIQNQGWYQSLVAIGETMLEGLEKVKVWWNEEGPGKFIADTFANIGKWWDEGPGKFLNEAFTNIGTWWDEKISQPINKMFTDIKTWWDEGPGKFFNETFTKIGTWWDEKIVQPIKGFFDWFFGSSSVEQKKKDIAKFVEDVKANFKQWTDGVAKFWQDLPGKIGEWFSNIGDALGKSFKGAVNGLIDALNNIKITIPSTVLGIPIPGGGGTIKPFNIPHLAKGGLVPGFGSGDKIPAMLTPGEFVIKKSVVQSLGVDKLTALNSNADLGGSVYNNTYSINVNVKSDADANEIARTVMTQIKNVDAQRVRGNRF